MTVARTLAASALALALAACQTAPAPRTPAEPAPVAAPVARTILQVEQVEDIAGGEPITIWNARSMFDAARVLGSAVRHVFERDGEALKRAGVDFNVSMIFGGQIGNEGMRLFQVYSAGNFIEATAETPFFQIGESKYGKPVIDRVVTPRTPLQEAAKQMLTDKELMEEGEKSQRYIHFVDAPTTQTAVGKVVSNLTEEQLKTVRRIIGGAAQ